jgi:hypothetical protein
MIRHVKHELEAIPKEKLRRPVLPMATALQEANDLLELCRGPDVSAALAEVGISSALTDDLALRLQAAREAQSAWASFRDGIARAPLAALEARAESHRRDMLAACRFGLRRTCDARVSLASFRGRAGLDGLVQDLFDLATLAERHAGAFERDRSFDAGESIFEARELARSLSLAVSEARLGAASSAALELRNRAFTHMDELVSELRAAGRYAFRHDPDTAKRFTSRHRQKLRRLAKRSDGSP